MLGKGAFGVVYSAEDKQAPETYACKSIAKAKLVSEVRDPNFNQCMPVLSPRLEPTTSYRLDR